MRLQDSYQKEIIPKLKEKFGYKNIFQIPRMEKVVINVGVGRHAKDKGFVENVENTLTKISGQKPVMNKAKKSISSFKIREGMVVGVSVVLRKKKMYDFIEKLINVSLPRIRDFRGIDEKVIDLQGNLNIGFKEHLSFPEIKVDEAENVHGLEITVVTNTKSREAGVELFKLLGFPFKK